MRHRFIYVLSGYLSLMIGVLATLCIFKMALMYYGIALAIMGFLVSGINIFLNAKYNFEDEKFPKGYFGMFLSSLPVIFLLLMIFRFRSN